MHKLFNSNYITNCFSLLSNLFESPCFFTGSMIYIIWGEMMMALYRAQVRPHMEYCSHLWAGAPQYQLEPFDRIQRRAFRIIGDPMICERLDTLALRETCHRCAFSTVFIMGSVLKNCLTCFLPPHCLTAQYDTSLIIHTTRIRITPPCGFVGTSFHALRNGEIQLLGNI